MPDGSMRLIRQAAGSFMVSQVAQRLLTGPGVNDVPVPHGL